MRPNRTGGVFGQLALAKESGMSYLLFGGRTPAQLRELAASSHQSQFERVLDVAEKYSDLTPPAEHPAESITYIGYVVANLSLAYVLTGQEHYRGAAVRWMLGAAKFEQWGRVHMADHDLDAGWLLFGLSVGYNWLQDVLSQEEKTVVQTKLVHHAQKMYDYARATEGGWWSSSFWQNHNWICYTGLATAGFALRSDPDESVSTCAERWVGLATANFRRIAEVLPLDGSDHEGPVYWRYGVPWLYTFYALLAEQTGEDLQQTPFLRETFFYRLYSSAPDFERTLNFGDCHDLRSSHSLALYYRVARLYQNGYAQWLAKYLVESGGFWREVHESSVRPGAYLEAFLEFLWYEPSVAATSPEDLPLVRHFEDIGLVLARSSWQPRRGRVLGFKCGPGPGYTALREAQRYKDALGWDVINAGHAHPDQNSFVLWDEQAYLLVDEGYSRNKLSAHHSTLLVDGVGQAGEGDYNIFKYVSPQNHGRITKVEYDEAAQVLYCIGDAAAAYSSETGLIKFERHIRYSLTDGSILLRDELEANAPKTFTILFQSYHEPRQVAPNVYAIENAGRTLQVQVLTANVTTSIAKYYIEANTSASSPQWKVAHYQYVLSISNVQKTNCAAFTTKLLCQTSMRPSS
jgi:hypothetical protein